MDYRDFDHLVRSMADGSLPPLRLASRRPDRHHQPAGARWDQRDRGAGQQRQGQGQREGQEGQGNPGQSGDEGGLGQAPAAARGIPARGTRSAVTAWSPREKGDTPPGNARRCTKAQTVVTTNPDGDRRKRQSFARPPSYWIDVACTFDAPLYRTVCDCIAYGQPTAPAVRTITLPPADICAVVIAEDASGGRAAAYGDE